MKVVGVKISTKQVRYAVVESDVEGKISWLNSDNSTWENRILFPKEANSRPSQIQFLYKEFDRVIRQERPDLLAIKVGEGIKGSYSAWALLVSSCESAIILAALAAHLPVVERRYAGLKLNSRTVEAFVLSRFARPPSLWDIQIAEAVAIAVKELEP